MKKKLVLGVTVGGSSRLLDGQAKYFKELGYEVYLISQDHYKEIIFCKREGIAHLPVKNIVADIHPIKDLKALFQIAKHFIKLKPDIVNVGTPKMGLLGMLVAFILGVKNRIYTCRGLRFETEKGIKRILLMAVEKMTVKLAHQVIYVSPSMFQAALNGGVAQESKSIVTLPGSSNGVNIQAFNRNNISVVERNKLIAKYDLQGKTVIGFVGRVSLHKGVYELFDAFELLYNENCDLKLIMMGHLKCDPSFEMKIKKHRGVIHIPFQDDVPLYMSLFDIFVLPSWREGFPNVPIQAAALGLPVIVSNSTGCIDSVQDGINGTIFQVKDSMALLKSIKRYLDNPELRIQHGSNGLEWAKHFAQEKIWNTFNSIYIS